MHHTSFPTKLSVSQDGGFDRQVFPGAVPVYKPTVEKAAWLSGLWERTPNLNVWSISPPTSGDTTLVDDTTVGLRDSSLNKDEDTLIDTIQPEHPREVSIELQESELGNPLRTQKDWLTLLLSKAQSAQDRYESNPSSPSPSLLHLEFTAATSHLRADAPAFVPASGRPSAPPTSQLAPHILYTTAPTSAVTRLATMSDTATLCPTSHHSEASLLVSSRWWGLDEIGHLARQFCHEGAQGLRQEPRNMAKFALQVRDRFRICCGESTARMFVPHLRNGVVGKFSSYWASSSPYGMAVGRDIHSGHLSAALCLATFVGDLFVNGLLPWNAIQRCIGILLQEMYSIEHLLGLHLLLKHATILLWKGAAGRGAKCNFLNEFVFKARRIPNNASVTGTKFGREEIQSLIDSVMGLVNPTFEASFNIPIHPEPVS